MITSTHTCELDPRSEEELKTLIEAIRDRIVAVMRQIRRSADPDRIRPVVDVFLAPLDRTGVQLLESALGTRTSQDLAFIARELLSIADEQGCWVPAAK
jgi:hypothetical protein